MFIFQVDPTQILKGVAQNSSVQTTDNPDSVLLGAISKGVEDSGGIHASCDPPPIKGDVNDDGTVDQQDIDLLDLSLRMLDFNEDGQLTQEDYTAFEQFLKDLVDPLNNSGLNSPPPFSETFGDLNGDHRADQKDLELFGKVLKAGDMDNDGKVDQADLDALNKLVNPPLPEFPAHVAIDMDGDGSIDYIIGQHGGAIDLDHEFVIIDVKNDTTVDSIPGVDLQKLSDEIKNQFNHGEVNPTEVHFDEDINGDGKIDHIDADNRSLPV